MSEALGLPDLPDDASFGEMLIALRRRAGLTGGQLGGLADMSQPTISRIERGVKAVSEPELRALARALGLSKEAVLAFSARAASQSLAERPRRSTSRLTPHSAADRQRKVAEQEDGTLEFRVFQNAVMVGLLQTSEYSRAVLGQIHDWAAGSHVADDIGDLADAVASRLGRQAVLEDPRKRFHFVMLESVLSYRLGSPPEMLAQLARLREVAGQSNVTVGIIPADTPLPMPAFHGFELLDDKLLLIDLIHLTQAFEDSDSVSLYRGMFDAYAEVAVTDIDPIVAPYYKRYLKEAQVEMPGA